VNPTRFVARVLHRLGLLSRINLTATVVAGDMRFRIPVVRGIGVNNLAISEPWRSACWVL
jgi:hypothetical protein